MTVDYKAIVDEAFAAAKEATNDYLAKHGDRDACGFAWVTIRPARGKLVSYLKSIGAGDKAYGGGFQIWNPSKSYTQAITAKEVGADAFANVIKKHLPDIQIYSGSRMD